MDTTQQEITHYYLVYIADEDGLVVALRAMDGKLVLEKGEGTDEELIQRAARMLSGHD